MSKKHLNVDALYYSVLRNPKFYLEIVLSSMLCLRRLKVILEKMTNKGYLEDVLLRYLKDT